MYVYRRRRCAAIMPNVSREREREREGVSERANELSAGGQAGACSDLYGRLNDVGRVVGASASDRALHTVARQTDDILDVFLVALRVVRSSTQSVGLFTLGLRECD